MEKGKNSSIDAKTVLLVIVAAALVLLAVQLSSKAPEKKAEAAAPAQMDTPAAKLLLSSFDRGAALKQYALRYSASQNGENSSYEIASNGSAAWVRESGSFGNREAFFTGNNTTNVVCLKYNDERHCAQVGTDAKATAIAANLRTLLPDTKTYLSQKSQVEKLILAGAIRFDGDIAGEKVGGFDTQKVSYTLDYHNLTVQTLISLGISPNDPTIYTITNWRVIYWIDRQSGMMVASRATYKENGVPSVFETRYSQLSLANVGVPPAETALVDVAGFVKFYQGAEKDYGEVLSCLSLGGGEHDACLKALAGRRMDWSLCKQISSRLEFESCTVMVAQGTNNYNLCTALDTLPDDCYIAVAGETGNADLCRNLKNTSLGGNCTLAAVAGKKKVDAILAEDQRRSEAQNCKADSNCSIFGNAKQYCAPKWADTGKFANESSPSFACLEGIPCGCAGGFCGFRKNDTYYACVAKVEDDLLKQFIQEEARKAQNNTNMTVNFNKTNSPP